MKKLDLTSPSERLIGFTVPRHGKFLICDHDEVWTVDIGAAPSIEVTDQAPYEVAKTNADFVGWGRNHGEVRRVGDTDVTYDFEPANDFVTVRYRAAGFTSEVKFRTFSGDWFAASLSDDGKYLVLAEPYDLAVYELT